MHPGGGGSWKNKELPSDRTENTLLMKLAFGCSSVLLPRLQEHIPSSISNMSSIPLLLILSTWGSLTEGTNSHGLTDRTSRTECMYGTVFWPAKQLLPPHLCFLLRTELSSIPGHPPRRRASQHPTHNEPSCISWLQSRPKMLDDMFLLLRTEHDRRNNGKKKQREQTKKKKTEHKTVTAINHKANTDRIGEGKRREGGVRKLGTEQNGAARSIAKLGERFLSTIEWTGAAGDHLRLPNSAR